MLQFIRFADIFGSRLVAAFDSIPAARYGYRPTPSQQTIGYIAQHLESANYSLCERLGVLKHPRTPKDSLSDTVKAQWPKDTLVGRLEVSLRFCDTAMERVGKLESAALASTLLAFETDLAEHYSQISSYMRLIGMVPPSALPQRPRVAIELPGVGAVTLRRRLRARVRPGARPHATERDAPYQVEHRHRRSATLAESNKRLLRQGRGRTSHVCARREWSGIGPRSPPVWPRPAGEETSLASPAPVSW